MQGNPQESLKTCVILKNGYIILKKLKKSWKTREVPKNSFELMSPEETRTHMKQFSSITTKIKRRTKQLTKSDFCPKIFLGGI